MKLESDVGVYINTRKTAIIFSQLQVAKKSF